MENVDMKKLPETISNQFIQLFLTLDKAMDDLKMTSAEACLIGDFPQVTTINASCQKLQAFKADIKATLNNFDSNYKVWPEQKISFPQKSKCRPLKKHGFYRIKVGDKIIEETTIVEAFVKALQVFGLDRVARLNKILTAAPLLSKIPINTYQRVRHCDGWYIVIHVNRVSAVKVLEEIGKDLNIPVNFEFIAR